MLNEIKKELETQDNLSTANPMFVVYDWEKIPTDPDYSSKSYYCHDEGEIGETIESVKKYLKDAEIDFPENLGDYSDFDFEEWTKKHCEEVRRIYYIKKRVYINCFFTRKAADEFIKLNHYHYSKEVHIYVNCLWRNPEMQFIRNGLLNGDFALKGKQKNPN